MKVFGLFDPDTGEQVFAGTPAECAEFCGGTTRGFYGRYTGTKGGTYHGYTVRVLPRVKPKTLDPELKKLAAEWDAFCEPIRKAYGIEVRRSDEDG